MAGYRRGGPGAGDVGERSQKILALVLSAAGGAIGAAGGFYAAFTGGAGIGILVLAVVLGSVLGYAAAYAGARFLVEGAGRLAGALFNPSGRSTPSRPEYSYPASLAARGRLEEAIAAYESCAAENPDDPEPCLRIARLYRDSLARYEDALLWFRRARQAPGIDPGRELLATREIIEICMTKLESPLRAAPELARIADRFPGTAAAEWARRELLEVRRSIERAPPLNGPET